MARVNHLLAHLIYTDPGEAKKQILEAFRREKMHVGNTAARIGCTHGTLLIWIARLTGLRSQIDKLKARAQDEGWHYVKEERGGRPKMSEDDRTAAKLERERTKRREEREARARNRVLREKREARAAKRKAA